MSPRCTALPAAIALLASLAGTAIAQPTTWAAVAVQPELLPVPAALGPNLGAGVNFNWANGLTSPSINQNGEINFTSGTSQAGTPTGIWHWNGSVNNNIALYGTTTVGGQLLTGSPGPTLGDSANGTAWRAATGSSVTTIVSNTGGPLSIVAQSNQPSVVPVAAGGTGTLNYSISSGGGILTSNTTGAVLFSSSLVNSAGATATGLVTTAGLTQNNTGLFIGTPAGVTLVARQGTVMGNDAGADYALRAMSSSAWTVNGPGTALFQSTLQGTSIVTTTTSSSATTNPNFVGTRNDTALMLATPSAGVYSLSTVARGGNAAVGAPAGVVYDTITTTPASLNNNGQYVFSATLRNGVPGAGVIGVSGATQNNSALYSNNGGSLAMIARQGQPVSPGSSTLFGSFNLGSAVQMTSNGTAFLNASLQGGASGNALYAFTAAGSTIEILRTGQAMPAFGTVPAGASFSSFQSYATNAMGCVVIYGILNTNAALGIYSDASGNNNRVLLAISPTGEYRLLARRGDAFDAANGGPFNLATTLDGRIIDTINFLGGSSGQDGRGTGINDAGQITFALQFNDGGIFTGGVYTATVVPTPGVAGLLGLAGLGIAGRRRR